MFVHATGPHKWPCRADEAIFLRVHQIKKLYNGMFLKYQMYFQSYFDKTFTFTVLTLNVILHIKEFFVLASSLKMRSLASNVFCKKNDIFAKVLIQKYTKIMFCLYDGTNSANVNKKRRSWKNLNLKKQFYS